MEHEHVWYHLGSGPTFDGDEAGRLDWCIVCGAIRDDRGAIVQPEATGPLNDVAALRLYHGQHPRNF